MLFQSCPLCNHSSLPPWSNSQYWSNDIHHGISRRECKDGLGDCRTTWCGIKYYRQWFCTFSSEGSHYAVPCQVIIPTFGIMMLTTNFNFTKSLRQVFEDQKSREDYREKIRRSSTPDSFSRLSALREKYLEEVHKVTPKQSPADLLSGMWKFRKGRSNLWFWIRV